MKVRQFRNIIRGHILDNPLAYTSDGVPIFIARHFFIKENEGTITNEERELECKITKLMSSLLSNDADDVVKSIFDKSIEYNDGYISILVTKKEDYIEVELLYDDGTDFYCVRSDAFLLKEDKESYFGDHIVIDTVSKEEKKFLGKVVELNVLKGR